MALGAAFAGWVLHQRAGDVSPSTPAAVAAATRAVSPANPYGELVFPRSPYGELVDPGFSKIAPARLATDSPPGAATPPPLPNLADGVPTAVPPGAGIPLPPPRPRLLASAVDEPARPREDRQSDKAVVDSAPPDDRNLFQRLFGAPRGSASPSTYAAPPPVAAPGDPRQSATATSGPPGGAGVAQSGFARDPRQNGALGVLQSAAASPSVRYDQFTAVYDLSAHVLYLPDGRRLEAHSGLGDRLDDPRHVDERMRGATPPHLYDLTLREGSFHGVQALRLNPVGQGGVYGRAGLLAHPFMLGPNGDSNGCVSIRDYDAFLQAYQRGQVKRLAVVASLH